MRVQIGGQIAVVAPEGAPAHIDGAELLSGADIVVPSNENLPPLDPANWRKRCPSRLVDSNDDAMEPIALFRAGEGALVLESPYEPLLIIAAAGSIPWGRWADDAVIVLSTDADSASMLDTVRPRLVALCGPESAIDAVFEALRTHAGNAPVQVLDAGLALEV